MPRFFYTASALGLGARFRRNGVETTIAGESSMVLANIGGRAWAEAQNFDYGGVSFVHASASASGRLVTLPGGQSVYRTELRMQVEGLSVLDTVHVERLCAEMVSEHPAPVPPHFTRDLGDGDISISMGPASGYAGVVVAGVPLTLEDRVAAFGGPLRTFKQIVEDEKAQGRNLKGRALVDTCLLARVAPAWQAPQGFQVHDSVTDDERLRYVSVPGFGRIFFGELLASKDLRRLNLLRIELDSSEGRRNPGRAARAGDADAQLEGDLVAGATVINGSSYP